ncbi:AAA family ATPase [Aliarcobacter butzleri]
MSKFGFLKDKTIGDLSDYGKRETIIKDFLLEKSINIFFGPAGLGKTWLLFAISKYCTSKGYDVVYLDSDNGIDTVKDRKYDLHIQQMGNKIHYINGDMLDSRDDMNQILTDIEDNSVVGYEKVIVILDSLQFFLNNDVYNEAKIDKMTAFAKKIRRAGGTVVFINHSTKDGKAMKGGGSLINALDEVYEISKNHDEDGILQFILTPSKYRMSVKKSAFIVDTETLSLESIDVQLASICDITQAFIDEVLEKLKDENLSQNQLLEQLGYNKADKAKIKILNSYVGRFWNCSTGANRAKIYEAIHTTQTTQEN